MVKKEEKKKQNKTELIPFTREDYIRQPNSVSRMEFKMDLIQLRVFARFLEKLEPMVLEILDLYHSGKADKKELSLFNATLARPFIEKGDGLFTVEIPLKDLGISPGYYHRAKDIILDMGNIPVRIYSITDEGEKRIMAGSAFYVDVSADEGKKRAKTVKVSVIRKVLDRMVDVRMGYHDQLKRIAFMATNIYTARLYVFVSSRMRSDKNHSFDVPIVDFRDFLDLYIYEGTKIKDIKYKRYTDLDKRVITPAVTELKKLADSGNSDFWITIDRVGKSGGGNPAYFRFNVFFTPLGIQILENKISLREDKEIQTALLALHQTRTNIRKIMLRLMPESQVEFSRWLKEFSKIIKERKDIDNLRSYAWSAIKAWLDDHEPHVEEIIEPEEKRKTDAIQQDLFDHPVIEKVMEEDYERWNMFMDLLHSEVSEYNFNTWFSVWRFISFKPPFLRVGVPSRFVAEYVENNLVQQMASAACKAFGEDCRVEYVFIS